MAISGIELTNGYAAAALKKQPGNTDTSDAWSALQHKLLASYDKTAGGNQENSFQIGGKSYTQSEWDKMLSKVDRVIEQIRTENREDLEAKERVAQAKAAGTHVETEITEDQIAELFRDRG